MRVLHNMSVPPRTSVVLQGKSVSGRIVVFSLTYAMFLSEWVYGMKATTATPLEQALETYDSVRNCIFRSPRTPVHLIAKMGEPIYPKVNCDFLVGWRPMRSHLALDPIVCTDPRVCAGVLSKCAGLLYLPNREPSLNWESLCAPPIAFYDSALILP
jgi:hypothetical protein